MDVTDVQHELEPSCPLFTASMNAGVARVCDVSGGPWAPYGASAVDRHRQRGRPSPERRFDLSVIRPGKAAPRRVDRSDRSRCCEHELPFFMCLPLPGFVTDQGDATATGRYTSWLRAGDYADACTGESGRRPRATGADTSPPLARFRLRKPSGMLRPASSCGSAWCPRRLIGGPPPLRKYRSMPYSAE